MARHTFRFKFVNQLGNTSGGRTNAELILGIVNVSAGNIVPGTQRRIVRTARERAHRSIGEYKAAGRTADMLDFVGKRRKVTVVNPHAVKPDAGEARTSS